MYRPQPPCRNTTSARQLGQWHRLGGHLLEDLERHEVPAEHLVPILALEPDQGDPARRAEVPGGTTAELGQAALLCRIFGEPGAREGAVGVLDFGRSLGIV